MEHFYKNIDSEMWFNYEDLYSLVVSKFPTNSHFVEVGVWKGMSACFMAVEIINSNKNIKFDCVDTWEYVPTSSELNEDKFENLYNIFLNNIEPVKDKINIIKGISWEAASNYEDNSLDFVFIDAGHDYESVKKDLATWAPKVKSTGIISGHDYHYDCGVYPAVNEFFGKEKIHTMKACWVYDKSR
jgi:predicted O-methyltransferase YrrM